MSIKDFPLDLVAEYNSRNISIRQLALNYKCSQSTVKRFLERNGGHIITKAQFLHEIKILPDTLVNEIAELYRSYVPMTEIAKRYNVPVATLRSYFVRHNIPYKTSKWILNKVLSFQKELIIRMYEEHKSLTPIAQHFNCNVKTIANFFDRHNIQRKNNGHDHIPETDKDLVYKMHHEQMMTMKQIGNHYGCSAPTVIEFFKIRNIPKRSKAEASTLVAQNPETIRKQKRSLFTHKSYTLPSGKIIKLQGYEPQFLDHVFKNGLLTEEQIVYDAPRISYIEDGKTRYYFPDFYISHLNLIVEVKSRWIYNKQGVENNSLKARATKNAGFEYILVLDNDYAQLNMSMERHK